MRDEEIEEEFLNRTTDRANKLIARIFLYSNFVCAVFLIAHYFDFFNMSYKFSLISWAGIIYFSITMFLFCRLNVNRTFTMYHGLLGVVFMISMMGTNNAIGVNISYGIATLFSCMYLVKRYTIIASTAGYIGMVISLLIKSQTMYLLDMTSDNPMEYFVPTLAGFTIEYIILILACTSITGILRQTVLELQKRTERIRTMQSKELQTFANIVECRDKFTGEHIERTSIYVKLIADELAKMDKFRNILTKDVVNIIIEAAPLHDLGKIQIPDQILKKPGRLSEDEYEIMKTHSEIGYNMIGSYLNEVIDEELLMYSEMMALYHHERYDGKGYPKGIEGEAIPLCARIMSVADVLDALLSKRHYKDAFPIEKAIDIIKDERGKMFDPDVVDCLLKVLPKIKELEQEADDVEMIEEL
ncbi:HD-GYP domain-containing protein [Treponema sp.]|uniref:HD-GYP domain-containing protein n=1 Tax=Treponema sp. TaxID=166 RepID=UPI00298E17B4|nr:HD domain-containing phosphohydrolase [Treponema sp.]MCQ2240695.1 HD domain-containing protein [Treponema sp.]